MPSVVYHVNPYKFKEIDSEEKAYWLGFIYADGCMSENSRIGVMLKSTDVNHLYKLKNFLEWDKEPVIRVNGKWERCELVFRCKSMFEDLLRLGCHPRKSKSLSFPTKEQVPDKFLFHFLRGYCDGDGYLGIYNKDGHQYSRLSFCGTYDFINGMLDRTKWKRNKIRVRDNGLSLIEWQGKFGKEYTRQMYQNATVFLDRKYKIATNVPF